MSNQNHPITPSLERLEKWNNLPLSTEEIFVIAAQWGADMELEACRIWLDKYGLGLTGLTALRAARRPKPPSLKEKEEALKALERMQDLYPHMGNTKTIRRVLEAL